MKLDRKKKILIGAAAVVVLIAAAGIGVWIYGSQTGSGTAKGNGAEDDASDLGSDQTGQDADASDDDAGDNGDDSSAAGDQTEGGVLPGGVGSLNIVPDVIINQDEEPGQETEESVELPYSIGGTELSVDKITSYDGIYIEDGSDEEISGVTAMVLTNHGDEDVEYAEVIAQQSDQTLSFKASAIPAGATVVVLEANKTVWSNQAVTQIYASATEGSEFGMARNAVQIQDNGDDSITVTNISEENIPCVRFFYKYKMEDNIYVGGIAYVAKLTDLDAGASQTVRPSHYVSGSSEILMARTYETTD